MSRSISFYFSCYWSCISYRNRAICSTVRLSILSHWICDKAVNNCRRSSRSIRNCVEWSVQPPWHHIMTATDWPTVNIAMSRSNPLLNSIPRVLQQQWYIYGGFIPISQKLRGLHLWSNRFWISSSIAHDCQGQRTIGKSILNSDPGTANAYPRHHWRWQN